MTAKPKYKLSPLEEAKYLLGKQIGLIERTIQNADINESQYHKEKLVEIWERQSKDLKEILNYINRVEQP